jgi:hypothetical protein
LHGDLTLQIVVRVLGLDGRNISTMGLYAAIGRMEEPAPSVRLDAHRRGFARAALAGYLTR